MMNKLLGQVMNENCSTVSAREFYYFEELREYFSYVNKKGKTTRPTYRTIKKMFAAGLKSSMLGNKLIVFKDDLKEYLEKSRSEAI